MADNPFDVNSMNGIVFGEGTFANVDQFRFSDGPATGPKVYPEYVFGLSSRYPGVATVVSSEYRAGYYYSSGSNSDYILPTFGAIQFANMVDGGGQPITYYIHGFSEHGILLTEEDRIGENGYIADGVGYTGGDSIGSLSNTWILSPNGFSYQGAIEGFPSYTAQAGESFDKDPTVLAVPVCFAAGTRIETVNGPVAVEDLTVGEIVLTASGTERAIKWIGDMVARPARHARPQEYNPVRIMPSALGESVPAALVRLSPGHAVYVDGVLVPIGRLVNGATIVQEDVADVRYFHIELDSHDILLAEGLPCESYLDDGNRRSFRSGNAYGALYGRLDPQCWDNACAPLIADGPQLAAVRARVQARMEALGWQRSEDADLTIEADGISLAPQRQEGNRYWFDVPPAGSVVLRSNSGVLAHLTHIGDNRLLGVAVAELRIDGVNADLDNTVFGEGFYPAERHEEHGWRWTNGAAKLVLGGQAATIEVAFLMVAPSWRRPLENLQVAA
ncbi:MAG: Hint domain-containing protein [Tsuneonella suprasediminis]